MASTSCTLSSLAARIGTPRRDRARCRRFTAIGRSTLACSTALASDALAQGLHQIDHLRALLLRLLCPNTTALRLQFPLDQLAQGILVMVFEALRIDRCVL